MKAEEARERAKARALRLLEKRDYSKAELAAKLVEKGEDPAEAEAVSERMAELGFVNDENYAGMVVRHYAAKGYGRARIREELRRRRVPRELWDAALCELPEQADTVERLLAAKALISNQGCSAKRVINRWPTIPVAPMIPTLYFSTFLPP